MIASARETAMMCVDSSLPDGRARSSAPAGAIAASLQPPIDSGVPAARQHDRVPGVLKHLHRLSATFEHHGERLCFLHVYATLRGPGREPPLAFIAARESGIEGVGCVDDAARAALLALRVHEQTGSPEALRLARAWLGFVAYMQEPDGGFVNFILDEAGTKNRWGRTSADGGAWWAARALWALGAAWRLTGDQRYREIMARGRLAATDDLKVTAVQALALLDLYRGRPDAVLRRRICARCDAIVASGHGYFRDRAGREEVALWGYHQLPAVAHAGRLFGRADYLAACAATVAHLVEPVIAGGFYHSYPSVREPQSAYDVSTLGLGLEELYRATGAARYRELALTCVAWLDGANIAGVPLYDADTGRCSDGLAHGRASPNCGAESAIEAGFLELTRRRLRGTCDESERGSAVSAIDV